MLLTKDVEIKWNPKIYKYYIEKGYKFTKWKDSFIVKIKDVYGYSSSIVHYKCDYCNEIIPISYGNYIKYHKNSKYIDKDSCINCVHKKRMEINKIKNDLNLLNKNNSGYWKKYENRLFELKEYLNTNTLDDLLDNGYSPILESIRRNKDNLLDMILKLNINIYSKCKSLSRFIFYLTEDNIKILIKNFIKNKNHFPSMLEIFEELQINYVTLAKYGGYHKFKKDLGYEDDVFIPINSFEYSSDYFKKYNNISGIYKITNIKNGKIYIGKAVNLWRRITDGYLYSLPYGKCHNIHLQRAWDKDGGENFYIEIVEIVNDIDKLSEREEYWINQTLCYKNKIGYNFKSESEGNNKRNMDDETREKLRQNTLKRKGWNHTQEVKDFLSEIKSNPVIQLDLDGKFIREWKNAGEAAHFYGGVENCIRSVAKKITTTSYGYIWVYKDEYDPLTFDVIEHFKRNKTIRRVVQLDLDNNYINTFRSISDAKLKTGASNIHVVCKGIQHKSGGYKWMFEEDYLKSKE